jgi:carbamate kinase
VRRGSRYEGVEAVIDKDRTAAILAIQLRAARLVLLTGVEHLMRDFGTATATPLEALALDDAERMLAAGSFAAGSMAPKIEAAVTFLRAGGREVLLTDPDHAGAALAGAAGTRIAV